LKALRTKNTTRILQPDKPFLPFPVLDYTVGNRPIKITTWVPSQAEKDLISQGAPIFVFLYHNDQPPIQVSVGRIPDTELDQKDLFDTVDIPL